MKRTFLSARSWLAAAAFCTSAHHSRSAGFSKAPDVAEQAKIEAAGDVGKFREAFEGAHDARQIDAQIIAGRIEQEVVVFLGLHIFAVKILVRLVVAHAISRPLQLLVACRVQRRAHRRLQHQRTDRIGIEVEHGAFGDLRRRVGVVHQLPVRHARTFASQTCDSVTGMRSGVRNSTQSMTRFQRAS